MAKLLKNLWKHSAYYVGKGMTMMTKYAPDETEEP